MTIQNRVTLAFIKQMTTQNRATLAFIKHTIEATMPPAEQKEVHKCAKLLREIIAEHGLHGRIALALVGAESAAKKATQGDP